MRAKLEQAGQPKVVAAQCGQCVHFCNAPAAMEAAFPGLTAMSSGYASVRAQDGLCNLHDVYLSYRDRCPSFTALPSTAG